MEHSGNTLGIEKKQKKSSHHPPCPPKFKRKKLSPL